jgi:superfamily II DNA or RNA helicase
MSTPRPRPSQADRDALYLRSGGNCEHCGKPIHPNAFHVAHIRAHAHGGGLHDRNTAAWCNACNLTQGARDAGDPRLPPRGWQARELDRIVERIVGTQVATVVAAPGGGKTIFTGLVFEALRDLGIVERMLVLVPRKTLVEQWAEALYKARDLQLRPNSVFERDRQRQAGVVCTYQSLLAPGVAENHREYAAMRPTLLALDEVHHLGESVRGEEARAWAKRVRELAGDVRGQINVAAVLNLSGTLWRTHKAERISTVRYVRDSDGKLLSDSDVDVEPPELIAEGNLRPVDLYRVEGVAQLIDWSNLTRHVSAIADLDEEAGRAAVRNLPTVSEWREPFVAAVLDRLEEAHRSLGNGPVPTKALVVAASQEHARAFTETANRQMRSRNLEPLAVVATVDDPNAHRTLEDFRRARRVGVLCAVDMASEGYDCPEIAVIGFASNKWTPLYVRQIVARGQRVTNHERATHVIPTAVVLPNVPALVDTVSAILESVRHELTEEEARERERVGGGVRTQRWELEGVDQVAEGDGRVVGEDEGDVAQGLMQRLRPELRDVGLESFQVKIGLAVQRATRRKRETQPFDPPDELDELVGGRSDLPVSTSTPVEVERVAEKLRKDLAADGGWWAKFGDTPVDYFNNEMNRAGGWGARGRKNAYIEELQRAEAWSRKTIVDYCNHTGQPLPRRLRGGKP